MKYIKTFKIVTPVLLAGGVLASIALADHMPSDPSAVQLSSSSSSSLSSPSSSPSATPSPAVSMSVNGKSVPVGEGETHYSDGQTNVSVQKSGGTVSAQTSSGGTSSTIVTGSGDGNVDIQLNSSSSGGNSWGNTQVYSNGTSYSTTQQFTSVTSTGTGTHVTP
jgi:hypothetical protein